MTELDGIPDFLRRPPMTPEMRRRLDRLNARMRNPVIRLKNPPKRVRAETKLLGMIPVQLQRKADPMLKNTQKPLGAKEAQTRALREANADGVAPKPETKAKKAKAALREAEAKPPKPPKAPKAAKSASAPAKAASAGKGASKVGAKKIPPKSPRWPVTAAPVKGGVRPGSKLELVVGLLTRPEGCTTADVLKATGWPAVSMPQQARAAGLKLKKEKDGSVTRYRAA